MGQYCDKLRRKIAKTHRSYICQMLYSEIYKRRCIIRIHSRFYTWQNMLTYADLSNGNEKQVWQNLQTAVLFWFSLKCVKISLQLGHFGPNRVTLSMIALDSQSDLGQENHRRKRKWGITSNSCTLIQVWNPLLCRFLICNLRQEMKQVVFAITRQTKDKLRAIIWVMKNNYHMLDVYHHPFIITDNSA